MDEKIETLVLKLQNGDEAAFEKIFTLYQVRAVRTAYLLTQNKALAEDIVQETFVQCYLKMHTLKDPKNFKAWFFKTLTRLAWKKGQLEQRTFPVENITDVYDPADDANLERDFIKKDVSQILLKAIYQLDPKLRTTVLLYYYREFSISEIAQIMGCLSGTVKSRLFTARKTLKKTLPLEANDFLKEAIAHDISF